MCPAAWVRDAAWFWQKPKPLVELVPLVPVEQVLRMGIDGEDLSSGNDELLTGCEGSPISEDSVVEEEFCFGTNSGLSRL